MSTYSKTICIGKSDVCPVLGSKSVVKCGRVGDFRGIVCKRVCLISFVVSKSRCLTIGCTGQSRGRKYVGLIDCGARRRPVSVPFTTVGTVTVIGFSVHERVVVWIFIEVGGCFG